MPISYAIDNGQHYRDLVTYKSEHPVLMARRRLSTIAELFVREHLACLSRALGGQPGGIAIVPSTRGRGGMHPLLDLLSLGGSRRLVTVVDTGRYPAGHREFAVDRFAVTDPTVDWGAGVLLFEDTWVSGAHIQSAAHALRAAGAPAVVAVVLGRFVRHEWEPARPLLAKIANRRFDTSVCAVCQT